MFVFLGNNIEKPSERKFHFAYKVGKDEIDDHTVTKFNKVPVILMDLEK